MKLTPDEFEVLFEDEWLLAVDKPAGVLVHGDGTGAATLTDAVREYLRATGEAEAASALQAVQRLDVDTTGVVLFSKRKAVQPALDALVAAHEGISKRYLAVVRGNVAPELRRIDVPLARDRHDARRMRAAPTPGAKPAVTLVRKLASTGARARATSLLELDLKTGRKHQIRVHLAHAGHPIVGDALYGVPADRRPGATLMLHAWREVFTHPQTGELVAIEAPYPARFEPFFAPETATTRR